MNKNHFLCLRTDAQKQQSQIWNDLSCLCCHQAACPQKSNGVGAGIFPINSNKIFYTTIRVSQYNAMYMYILRIHIRRVLARARGRMLAQAGSVWYLNPASLTSGHSPRVPGVFSSGDVEMFQSFFTSRRSVLRDSPVLAIAGPPSFFLLHLSFSPSCPNLNIQNIYSPTLLALRCSGDALCVRAYER